MGTLTEVDKNYLAQNFLAFFNRDYRRVAQAHLDAGWVPRGHAGRRVRGRDPRGVRADLRPAAEGDLLRQAAAAPVPDLAALQHRDPAAARAAAEDAAQHRGPRAASSIPTSTCGRRPSRYLERWMREQVGWRGLVRTIRHEAPFWAATLPQLPRLRAPCARRGSRWAGCRRRSSAWRLTGAAQPPAAGAGRRCIAVIAGGFSRYRL